MDKMTGSRRHQNSPSSKPYICNKCHRNFQLQNMYACYHGHYVCRSCFQKNIADRQFYQSSTDNCADNLGPSSHFLMEQGPSHHVYDQEMGDPMKQSPSMFPNPASYQQNTIDNHNSLISLATIYKPSLLNLSVFSKKPIICPQYDCRKMIAVSSLNSHFHYEHKQVATIVTQLETRNCLEFDFKDLQAKNKNMCLVLIDLEDEPRLASADTLLPNSTSRTNGVKPFFILIAAKIPNCRGEEDAMAIPATKEEKSQERVFFYVTCNILGNYCYTIAVSTPRQNLRIKYFGPLLSVNDDFRKLCDEGKGLVLSQHQINRLANHCSNQVTLDLILHERDDPCYTD